jgi:2'-5' RNA ligase
MGLAVVLLFDAATTQAVLALRQELIRAGLPPTLDGMADPPHLSLAVFADDAAASPLGDACATFARATPPLPLTLSAVGVFPSAEGVLFLAPTPTEALLQHHRAFHALLGAAPSGLNPYYQPDTWVPHCTLVAGLSPAQMTTALDVCLRAFRPLGGRGDRVCLIQFHPITVLQTLPLDGAVRTGAPPSPPGRSGCHPHPA